MLPQRKDNAIPEVIVRAIAVASIIPEGIKASFVWSTIVEIQLRDCYFRQKTKESKKMLLRTSKVYKNHKLQ